MTLPSRLTAYAHRVYHSNQTNNQVLVRALDQLEPTGAERRFQRGRGHEGMFPFTSRTVGRIFPTKPPYERKWRLRAAHPWTGVDHGWRISVVRPGARTGPSSSPQMRSGDRPAARLRLPAASRLCSRSLIARGAANAIIFGPGFCLEARRSSSRLFRLGGGIESAQIAVLDSAGPARLKVLIRGGSDAHLRPDRASRSTVVAGYGARRGLRPPTAGSGRDARAGGRRCGHDRPWGAVLRRGGRPMARSVATCQAAPVHPRGRPSCRWIVRVRCFTAAGLSPLGLGPSTSACRRTAHSSQWRLDTRCVDVRFLRVGHAEPADDSHCGGQPAAQGARFEPALDARREAHHLFVEPSRVPAVCLAAWRMAPAAMSRSSPCAKDLIDLRPDWLASPDGRQLFSSAKLPPWAVSVRFGQTRAIRDGPSGCQRLLF